MTEVSRKLSPVSWLVVAWLMLVLLVFSFWYGTRHTGHSSGLGAIEFAFVAALAGPLGLFSTKCSWQMRTLRDGTVPLHEDLLNLALHGPPWLVSALSSVLAAAMLVLGVYGLISS